MTALSRVPAGAARLARARLRLAVGPGDVDRSRTAARRRDGPAPDLTGASDAAILLAADPELAARAMRLAAAAMSGHDVAQQVARGPRDALVALLGTEPYAFALACREAGRPATGLQGAALADRIAADRLACRALWRAGLPPSLLACTGDIEQMGTPALHDRAAMTRCLAAALDAVTALPEAPAA